MRKLIKERMENKVVNFVGLNKLVLGIKWKNEMIKHRLSGGWKKNIEMAITQAIGLSKTR